MNRRRIAVAAMLAGLALPAAAAGQGVEECIAENGPRYSSPDDATTHQYVDTGGLCADAQDDGTDVQITPIGGGKKPAARPQTRTNTATTPAPAPAPAPEPTPAPEPQAQTTPAPTPKPTAKPTPQVSGAPQATASTTVAAALKAGEADRALSTPTGLASVPGGIGGVALVALGLAGAGVGMRRLGRR